ncbi:hypothetical protein DFH08DRAFT_801819 [Mycena albidolilacea]|uniref:Uncharacterized protein n=1 Tax=Mycena albidolilacea TaxID=1033008 RepID=A0AAD7AG23_9AGAR|nr:hypothetical protein DFH08DRAFT_801819 [Mycena albidolilacea]
MSTYVGLPQCTPVYLQLPRWTAFGYLQLPQSTSVSVGTLTPSKLTLLIWALVLHYFWNTSRFDITALPNMCTDIDSSGNPIKKSPDFPSFAPLQQLWQLAYSSQFTVNFSSMWFESSLEKPDLGLPQSTSIYRVDRQ